MKLLTLLTLLLSFGASANQVVEVEAEKAKLIKKAVVQALRGKKASCTRVVSAPGEASYYIVSSIDLRNFVKPTTSVSINSNNNQPIITLTSELANNQKVTLEYTTTSDFKDIISRYYQKVEVETYEKNIGTIIDPYFETVTEELVISSSDCLIENE